MEKVKRQGDGGANVLEAALAVPVNIDLLEAFERAVLKPSKARDVYAWGASWKECQSSRTLLGFTE